ncbi:MAG TPA: NAD-dependent epimerase/dehydratase family protein, partial [Pseudonocardiaceae bacterium]|nr:NAD-dependent epimerase/dehydratase family protein [Pseudonocardiaceae bacterium]
MVTRILVTGGTGTLGREVVRQLAGGGPVVRVLSRRPRPAGQPAEIEWAVGDLGTGAGIDVAVGDVNTIIHCASDARRGKE